MSYTRSQHQLPRTISPTSFFFSSGKRITGPASCALTFRRNWFPEIVNNVGFPSSSRLPKSGTRSRFKLFSPLSGQAKRGDHLDALSLVEFFRRARARLVLFSCFFALYGPLYFSYWPTSPPSIDLGNIIRVTRAAKFYKGLQCYFIKYFTRYMKE